MTTRLITIGESAGEYGYSDGSALPASLWVEDSGQLPAGLLQWERSRAEQQHNVLHPGVHWLP